MVQGSDRPISSRSRSPRREPIATGPSPDMPLLEQHPDDVRISRGRPELVIGPVHRRLDISNFKGTDEESIDQWLWEYQHAGEDHNWTDKEFKRRLYSYLDGEARYWYTFNGSQNRFQLRGQHVEWNSLTWPQVIEILREKFRNNGELDDQKRRWKAMQQPSEVTSEFIRNKIRTGTLLGKPDEKIVKKILETARREYTERFKELRRFIKMTPHDLLETIKDLEENKKAAKVKVESKTES